MRKQGVIYRLGICFGVAVLGMAAVMLAGGGGVWFYAAALMLLLIAGAGCHYASVSGERALVKQLAVELSRAAAGEIRLERIRDTYPACYGALIKNFEDTYLGLRSVSRDYQVTAGQVAAAVEQMKVASGDAGESLSLFEKLTDAFGSLSSLSDDLERQVINNKEAVDGCMAALGQARGAIDMIKADAGISAEAMGRLGDSIKRVDDIIASIGQISDNTRLLALNAAIEAARAGEHGKGFTIVAQEVRKLSDRTHQSVRETVEILRAVSEQSKAVEENLRRGENSIQSGVRDISRVEDSISSMHDAVATVSEVAVGANREVGSYFDRMSAALETLNASFKGISTVGAMLTGMAAAIEKNVQNISLAEVEQDSGNDEVTGRVFGEMRKLARMPGIISCGEDEHRRTLARALQANEALFEAVWSNRDDGSFIFSQPPAGLANARIREWWQRAVAGEEYISPVYISAITRKPCRTLSLPIRDGGRVVGVLGVDLSLDGAP